LCAGALRGAKAVSAAAAGRAGRQENRHVLNGYIDGPHNEGSPVWRHVLTSPVIFLPASTPRALRCVSVSSLARCFRPNAKRARPISSKRSRLVRGSGQRAQEGIHVNNQELAESFKQLLTLRWSPVAVKLLKPGEAVPAGVSEPSTPLRHCQAITAARRGNSIYMPPSKHACPDGSAIMGLVPMSAKLRSGELYLLFKKLPNLEIAQKMIASRPEFPAGSYRASVVAPLEDAQFEPDVVIFTIYPEQVMWLCCATSYGSGERQVFHTSGYNSTCSDLTVQVMQSQSMNISFGCYGARAISDISDFEAYLSVPYRQLPDLIAALQKLAVKSIPEARRKIYLPPVIDNVGVTLGSESYSVQVKINGERCNGCGLCVAFCPESVLEMGGSADSPKALAQTGDKCCTCYTCVGQCPQKAIQLEIATT
jgi:uncharacterized protein (DUF169 family)/NAD-dependent dihydropyrimidine dehydrogenase PreA subunit